MVIKKISLCLVFFLLIFGCRSKSGSQENAVQKEDATGFNQLEEIKEVYYRFPSPDEMLHFIDKEKLRFDDQVLLPIENAKNYLDSRSQAMNLGIYIADMAYISLFERQKEAMIYFQVVYALCDKLRMSSVFEPALMRRLEENVGNVDSLKVLLDESMTRITNYLVENNKERVFAVISLGGYVESLCLAFNLVNGYSADNLIIQRISDQKLVIENLLAYASEYADDPNVAAAIEIIKPIREVFNELSTSNKETSVKKSNDGKLIISGGEKITITKEQFNKLRDITFATRKKIADNTEN